MAQVAQASGVEEADFNRLKIEFEPDSKKLSPEDWASVLEYVRKVRSYPQYKKFQYSRKTVSLEIVMKDETVTIKRL